MVQSHQSNYCKIENTGGIRCALVSFARVTCITSKMQWTQLKYIWSVELDSFLGVIWMQRKPVIPAMRQNEVCFWWDQKREKERSSALLAAARENQRPLQNPKQPSYHLQHQNCHLISTLTTTLCYTHQPHTTALHSGKKCMYFLSAQMINRCCFPVFTICTSII